MANEVQSIVEGIQSLGEGVAKYWLLTVVLPLVVAGLVFVTAVIWLLRECVKGRGGHHRENQ
jgi:hypothetical protein